MSSLSDKTVLVTGASGGIGLETAKMLSLAGAKVVGCARRLDVLEAEMKSLPGSAIAVHVDVADRLSVESLMDRIPDEWRSIDILVNNAGSDVGGRQSFDQGRIDEWVGTIDINVSGLMRVTAACIPGMIERGDGHIVNWVRPRASMVLRDAQLMRPVNMQFMDSARRSGRSMQEREYASRRYCRVWCERILQQRDFQIVIVVMRFMMPMDNALRQRILPVASFLHWNSLLTPSSARWSWRLITINGGTGDG